MAKFDWTSFIHWPYSEKTSRSWQLMGNLAYSICHLAANIWMKRLNEMRVINRRNLVQAIFHRHKNVPLITVSNHTSCIDDPLIWSTIQVRPFESLKGHRTCARYIMGAREMVFTRLWHSVFFSWCWVVPIVRGYGVYQRGVNFSLEKLNEGGWVHVFAEGQVNMNPIHKTLRLKWGVGRLVSECVNVPVVLPIWHVGMEDVLPNRSPYIPRICKRVTVLIGDPIGECGVVGVCRNDCVVYVDVKMDRYRDWYKYDYI